MEGGWMDERMDIRWVGWMDGRGLRMDGRWVDR